MTQEAFIKQMIEFKRFDLTDHEAEIAIKQAKIHDLFYEAFSEFPPMLVQFFDLYSDKLLDEKIEVLTALTNGKTIGEIPNFYDILELYPKDEAIIWD